MNKIIKHFKSSILGVLFIATALYLLIQSISTDYYIIGGLLVSGTLLLFASDRFIIMLETAVKEFITKKQE